MSTGVSPGKGQQYDPLRNRQYTPPVQLNRGPSVHDGMSITAFVLAFFFPFIGFILGWVAVRTAHKAGRQASGLAVAGLVIGLAASVIVTVVLVAVAVSAAHGAAAPDPTQSYINCVNNAIGNGTDASLCTP